MKTRHVRTLACFLLLTMFSQTLLAATRLGLCSVESGGPSAPASNISPCHGNAPVTTPATANAALEQPDDLHHNTQHHIQHQNSPLNNPPGHCEVDCSCCWNACSTTLLTGNAVTMTWVPAAETYHSIGAALPASPFEQPLRPPCHA